jgi:hypothetical protein
MNLPFTTDQFLDVFRSYNLSVWPVQVLIIIFAILALFFAVYKIRSSDTFISIVLYSFWLWMGLVYHLLFFSRINPLAFAFAALFVLQALLFLYYGTVKRTLHFTYVNNIKGLTALILLMYALLFYPLLGYYFGNLYPATPTFGLPCPTTIFTFALLLLSEGKMKKVFLIIPSIWAVIGFTAAIKLGILQDIGLLVSAVLTDTLVFFERKPKLT